MQGYQIYSDVIDIDLETEFVDLVILNVIGIVPGGSNSPFTYYGTFGLATMRISSELECLPGFIGRNCVPICSTNPCRNDDTTYCIRHHKCWHHHRDKKSHYTTTTATTRTVAIVSYSAGRTVTRSGSSNIGSVTGYHNVFIIVFIIVALL